jgi:hypothetical protein
MKRKRLAAPIASLSVDTFFLSLPFCFCIIELPVLAAPAPPDVERAC